MKVYCRSGSIVNSLGSDIDQHWNGVLDQSTTLQPKQLFNGFDTFASYLSEDQWKQLQINHGSKSKCALISIESINKALEGIDIDITDSVIIIATTKGDIQEIPQRLSKKNTSFYPYNIGIQIDNYFKSGIPTVVLSNACISGSQAIQLGASYIKSGKVRNAIICGVDLITEFTMSGFNSLKALSDEAARPFDRDRKGISLGEAAATLILSADSGAFNDQADIEFDGGIVTNDANHISGPSRSGEGLFTALSQLSKSIKKNPDAISLHGTGTIFNDDMESVALNRMGFDHIECFGLKGIYGHTLGATGVIESVISLLALAHNIVPATVNYSHPGTVEQLNILTSDTLKQLNTIFKCASGFGGGNCVLSFSKIDIS